jgi:hypothetical protein
MSEFAIMQGDSSPIVRTTLTDGDGAIDLSLYNVYFIYKAKYQTGLAPTTGAAAIVSAISGMAEYAWQNTDVKNPGVFYCLWKISGVTSNEWSTFPNNSYLKYTISKVL